MGFLIIDPAVLPHGIQAVNRALKNRVSPFHFTIQCLDHIIPPGIIGKRDRYKLFVNRLKVRGTECDWNQALILDCVAKGFQLLIGCRRLPSVFFEHIHIVPKHQRLIGIRDGIDLSVHLAGIERPLENNLVKT